jgi:hypothetical protein
MVGNVYRATGGNTVNYSASARIRPSGVNCSVPQVKKLKVGILQNLNSDVATKTWSNPTIAWNAGVASGTRVVVPTTMRLTINVPHRSNDSEATVAPLYDQPGKGGTIDRDSLKPPTGCPGSANATSNDALQTSAPLTFTKTARTTTGANVGTITYRRVNVTLNEPFITWAVIFNTTTNHLCVLRERTWQVNVDSAGAGPQRATVSASDRAPTVTPVTAPPFANANANNRAFRTISAVGAATTTFTKP